jgi:hypothetical protein
MKPLRGFKTYKITNLLLLMEPLRGSGQNSNICDISVVGVQQYFKQTIITLINAGRVSTIQETYIDYIYTLWGC